MEKFAIPGAGGIIEKVAEGVGYILIQDRYKENAPMEDGLIEISAGKIREFENIYDCLRREIREETGLEVIEIEGENEAVFVESNGYKVINYMPFSCSQNISGSYPIMVNTFICRVKGKELIESDESRNMRWVPILELKDMLDRNQERFYPMHVTALKKYISYKMGNC